MARPVWDSRGAKLIAPFSKEHADSEWRDSRGMGTVNRLVFRLADKHGVDPARAAEMKFRKEEYIEEYMKDEDWDNSKSIGVTESKAKEATRGLLEAYEEYANSIRPMNSALKKVAGEIRDSRMSLTQEFHKITQAAIAFKNVADSRDFSKSLANLKEMVVALEKLQAFSESGLISRLSRMEHGEEK